MAVMEIALGWDVTYRSMWAEDPTHEMGIIYLSLLADNDNNLGDDVVWPESTGYATKNWWIITHEAPISDARLAEGGVRVHLIEPPCYVAS